MSAVVASYVGEAAPVASDTITALLPVALSSATVRNTLAELADLSLVAKPHRSAGRIPTLAGFRVYVGQLLEPRTLGPYEERDLADQLDTGTGTGESFGRALSRLLSERSRQLGFVLAPRLDQVVLQHVSFVRVSTERILCVLVSRDGATYRRVLDEVGHGDQPRLDRLATRLNERVVGETLSSLRRRLLRETADLHSQAEQLLERALRDGQVASGSEDGGELLVATWLALLEQPEFQDVERVRTLHRILEENQRLIEVIDQVLHHEGVTVVFGDDTGEEALQDCAIVAAPYGGSASRRGFLGVIGPSRLDYQRVVPLVACLSQLASEWMVE